MKKPGSNVKSGWPYHSSRNPNGLRGEWAWVKMFFPAWKKKKKRLQKLQMLMMISAGEEEMAWWRMRSLSRYWDNWPWTSQGTEAALSSERGIPSFGSRPICGAWRDIRVYARTPVLWVSGSWWSGLPLQNVKKETKTTVMGAGGWFWNCASQQRGDLAVSGVILGCPNLGEGVIGASWVEARGVAQHPPVCSAAPHHPAHTQGWSEQNISGAAGEKLALWGSLKQNSHKYVFLFL